MPSSRLNSMSNHSRSFVALLIALVATVGAGAAQAAVEPAGLASARPCAPRILVGAHHRPMPVGSICYVRYGTGDSRIALRRPAAR